MVKSMEVKVTFLLLPLATCYIYVLVYTEFILTQLCRKLLAYRNTLESVPETTQY